MKQQNPSQTHTKLPQSLIQQIHSQQQKYNSISQLSLYSTLTHIQQLSIFTKSTYDVQCNLTFCYFGNKYTAQHKKDITYYIIRMFNQEIPNLKNRYSIAYVHEDISGFLFFRSILRLLPEHFLDKLKEFWIVGAGIGIRIVQMFSFGEFNSFLKSKTNHVERLSQIQTSNKINFYGRTPSQHSQHHLTQTHPTKLLEDSSTKLIRNKLYGKQLIDYSLSQNGIPVILQFLLLHLYATTHYLQAEGIMRKSCDVQQLEVLQQKIMQDMEGGSWKKYVQQHDDVYVICGCVKKLLNNLNTPVFSYQIYQLIMPYRSDGHVQNDIQFVRNCLAKMPALNLLVLSFTICFLKYGIITYKQKNKMPAYNLAVVFGPCFFRPKHYRLEDLMSSGKYSFIIKLMLENYEDIFSEQLVKKCYNLLEKNRVNSI